MLKLLLPLLLAFPAWSGGAKVQKDRNALWKIVSCVAAEPNAAYASPTAPFDGCEAAVFSDQPGRFVLIEDLKMARCSANAAARQDVPGSFRYIHLLALPFAKTTGAEDYNKPPGVWAFAWKNAQVYMPVGKALAMVVNPKSARSQDQLHVHVAPLLPGAREDMKALHPIYLEDLEPHGDYDPVWSAAERHSGQKLDSGKVGVAVAWDQQERAFAVVTVKGSPESLFVAKCP